MLATHLPYLHPLNRKWGEGFAGKRNLVTSASRCWSWREDCGPRYPDIQGLLAHRVVSPPYFGPQAIGTVIAAFSRCSSHLARHLNTQHCWRRDSRWRPYKLMGWRGGAWVFLRALNCHQLKRIVVAINRLRAAACQRQRDNPADSKRKMSLCTRFKSVQFSNTPFEDPHRVFVSENIILWAISRSLWPFWAWGLSVLRLSASSTSSGVEWSPLASLLPVGGVADRKMVWYSINQEISTSTSSRIHTLGTLSAPSPWRALAWNRPSAATTRLCYAMGLAGGLGVMD